MGLHVILSTCMLWLAANGVIGEGINDFGNQLIDSTDSADAIFVRTEATTSETKQTSDSTTASMIRVEADTTSETKPSSDSTTDSIATTSETKPSSDSTTDSIATTSETKPSSDSTTDSIATTSETKPSSDSTTDSIATTSETKPSSDSTTDSIATTSETKPSSDSTTSASMIRVEADTTSETNPSSDSTASSSITSTTSIVTSEQTTSSEIIMNRNTDTTTETTRNQQIITLSTPTDICSCPGANLRCLIEAMSNSINGRCPPCPTSCPTTASPECDFNRQCASGSKCEIRDDSSYICQLESGEGGECSYTDNCLDSEECDILRGRKVEQTCTPGLFCREISKSKCVVTGVCVNITNASDYEATCLRNPSVSSSRCSSDGNYLCSSTERTIDGSVVQTCYNITSGDTLSVVRRSSDSNILEKNCRRMNFDACLTHNRISVLSGDKVDDPNNRCSYCLCKNGVIDRTMCKTNSRCVQSPESCTLNGRTILDGRVVSSLTTCVQMRCANGVLRESTLDNDCNGRDDTDACTLEQNTELVCVELDSGIKSRLPKCRAIALGYNYVNGRCGQNEVCNCQSDEICVPVKRARDVCISPNNSGCKTTKCIPINSNITCSTDDTNISPVCSNSGVTYRSECESFINLEYDIKYHRACDDQLCQADNNGEGFCGFDKQRYANLCDLELATGSVTPDYFGSCVVEQSQLDSKCERIPPECFHTTKASDSMCPIAGAQGILHIDVDEVQDYAFRKGKSEVDLKDLCREVESDWEILINYSLFDERCEFSCRHKYDTVGAIVVQVKAVSGTDCSECGERLRVFIERLREDKAGDTSASSNRKRRQTDGSALMGSGLFISPSELENDPSFQTGTTGIGIVFLVVVSIAACLNRLFSPLV